MAGRRGLVSVTDWLRSHQMILAQLLNTFGVLVYRLLVFFRLEEFVPCSLVGFCVLSRWRTGRCSVRRRRRGCTGIILILMCAIHSIGLGKCARCGVCGRTGRGWGWGW